MSPTRYGAIGVVGPPTWVLLGHSLTASVWDFNSLRKPSAGKTKTCFGTGVSSQFRFTCSMLPGEHVVHSVISTMFSMGNNGQRSGSSL